MQRSLFSMALILWLQAYLIGPDLAKIPMFVQHFLEHKTEDPQFTFAAFIDMHYANEEHAENGDHDHERLPYHHHHGQGADHCGCSMFMVRSGKDAVHTDQFDLSDHAVSNEDGELPGYRIGLIQPPRPLA